METGSMFGEEAGAARLHVSPQTIDTMNVANSGQGNSHNEGSASAILTGADVVSPITSPIPPDTDASGIVPSRHFIFEDPHDYFSHRNEIVQNAIEECKSTLIVPAEDGEFIGSWILTQISYWDTEKERVIILTKKALLVIKYDFIAMKKKEFQRIPLLIIDTLVVGLLVYPPLSVVPRINGIANGVSTVVRECILDRFAHSNTTMPPSARKEDKLGTFNLKNFEARNRDMRGVRLMWNQGQPLPFIKKWNPFETSIPFVTYSSHPIFWHKGGESDESSKKMFDVEEFSRKLIDTIEECSSDCKVHHASIVLQNYVGLPSLIHNKTSLGFFKVRGNFSF